jgi:hypothetical protein
VLFGQRTATRARLLFEQFQGLFEVLVRRS